MSLCSDTLRESPTVDNGEALEAHDVLDLMKDALTSTSATPLKHIPKRFDPEFERRKTTTWQPSGCLTEQSDLLGQ